MGNVGVKEVCLNGNGVVAPKCGVNGVRTCRIYLAGTEVNQSLACQGAGTWGK